MTEKRIYSRGSAIERAIEHIILDANDCWLWDGATTSGGYGHINTGDGHYEQAHRVTYKHFRGDIPEGTELDHVCRVERCANPWHVEPVTHRENVLRGNAPNVLLHRSGRCKQGHSLADAHRDQRGRVRNCRTCRNEKRRAGIWT